MSSLSNSFLWDDGLKLFLPLTTFIENPLQENNFNKEDGE